MTASSIRSAPEVIRFVDLCAGLGGFHHGLTLAQRALSATSSTALSFECVLAAEIDDELRELYVRNFPGIERAYRERFLPDETARLVQIAREVEPRNAAGLDLYDEQRNLVRVHGDLNSLVDAARGELRRGLGGEPIIPEHDLLCAGFPCQPFSKSGSQRGFEDTRGTLFHLLAIVIEHRAPDLVLLENVGNFERHDAGNTWRRVRSILEDLGYEVAATEHLASNASAGGLLSPHHIGVPHHRERFFIIAQRIGSPRFLELRQRHPFPTAYRRSRSSQEQRRKLEARATDRLASIISGPRVDSPKDLQLARLSDDRLAAVEHWGKLLSKLAAADAAQGKPHWRRSMPSFPIWGYELDPWQWYPIDQNPATLRAHPEVLRAGRSAHLEEAAAALRHRSAGAVDLLAHPPTCRAFLAEPQLTAAAAAAWAGTWPGYAAQRTTWPRWKQRFIEQNREWALRLWSELEPGWLREWIDTLFARFPAASHHKLEWNCKEADLDITQHIIQFRPSGIRVQRLRHIPALVAMTTTQVPVVPEWKAADQGQPPVRMRHLLPSEALQLQGFPPDWHRPRGRERVFHALGNAVNAELVAEIVRCWIVIKDMRSDRCDEGVRTDDHAELLLMSA